MSLITRRRLIAGLVLAPLALWALYGASLAGLGYACAFSRGESPACYVLAQDLGWALAAEGYMERDRWRWTLRYVRTIQNRRMLQRYEAGCEEGQPFTCHELANFLSAGMDGIPDDPVRVAALHDRICNRTVPGDRWEEAPPAADWAPGSCVALGDAYLEGRGVPQDRGRARRLYAGACEATEHGPGIGCSNLAHMVFAAGEDPNEARRLAMLTCDATDLWPWACLLAACVDEGNPDEQLIARACKGPSMGLACIPPQLTPAERCWRYRRTVHARYAP